MKPRLAQPPRIVDVFDALRPSVRARWVWRELCANYPSRAQRYSNTPTRYAEAQLCRLALKYGQIHSNTPNLGNSACVTHNQVRLCVYYLDTVGDRGLCDRRAIMEPRPPAGSPPRASTMDLRLKDMPDDLTREQQSEYIIKHCNLKDPMWHFVWVLSKKKSNVRFQCKLCGEEGTSAGVFTGGPAKIRCHFLANMFGCVTCTVVGEEREKANEASHQSVDDELAAKQKRDLEKKRKRQIEEGRLAEQNRLKQQKLEGSLSGAGTVDYTKEGLDQLWAKAVYAAPTSFNLLKNPFGIEAIEATSRFLLPPSSRKVDVVEQQPKYTPPSPDRLGDTLRTSISKSTSDRLCALQNTEAVKYGINATSDGWSSNPQHRPIEAQLFETPTVTRLNHAEDLSGETKSEIKIAQKLGQWADKGCDDMGVPKSTNDFMCVDGAEIASVNLLMAGAEENGIKLEPRPWLSGGVCTPHSLDLELEDIAKLPFVSSHMEEVFAYISSESAASLRARTSSVRARTSIIFLPPVFCVPSQKKTMHQVHS